MKKSALIYALIACLILPTVVLVTSAHSGRTDGSGGHMNHSTGKYHYHHGYSAHDHYDMDGDGIKDCPYDFKDTTNRSNFSGNNNSNNTDPDDLVIPTFNFDEITFPTFDYDTDFGNNDYVPIYNQQPKKTDPEDEKKAKTFFLTFVGIYVSAIIIPSFIKKLKK